MQVIITYEEKHMEYHINDFLPVCGMTHLNTVPKEMGFVLRSKGKFHSLTKEWRGLSLSSGRHVQRPVDTRPSQAPSCTDGDPERGEE